MPGTAIRVRPAGLLSVSRYNSMRLTDPFTVQERSILFVEPVAERQTVVPPPLPQLLWAKVTGIDIKKTNTKDRLIIESLLIKFLLMESVEILLRYSGIDNHELERYSYCYFSAKALIHAYRVSQNPW